MPETILKVLLAELATVRIVCHGCNAVFELSLDHLPNDLVHHPQCPLCKQSFELAGDGGESLNALEEFSKAYRSLSSLSKKISVEFPVKVKE